MVTDALRLAALERLAGAFPEVVGTCTHIRLGFACSRKGDHKAAVR